LTGAGQITAKPAHVVRPQSGSVPNAPHLADMPQTFLYEKKLLCIGLLVASGSMPTPSTSSREHRSHWLAKP
jgi:hypothetical protein